VKQISLVRGGIALALASAFPIALRADVAGTVTLQSSDIFSFDTGAKATSGGDIQFTGNSLTLQGSATIFNEGPLGMTGYNALVQAVASVLPLQAYNQGPLSGGSLVVGDVFLVHTNAGNYAKALITAASAGSITLQYDTFGVSGGAGPPAITDIENNSSVIPPGFPNSGVAPSTLIVIHGSGLADPGTPAVLEDSTLGLPLTLNGASISVTVNGVTTNPAIYYTSPTQIDAVLPAATPVGTGTLTVTYKGTPSAPAAIQVVPNALGIDTYNGGAAVATDAVTYALLTPTSSGKPGEIITLWGTGLGADPNDSDTTYTKTPHAVNAPLQVYIGGVQAAISYQGATVYPGVDVIVVTIPQSVSNGCFVPVVGVVGNVVGNTSTMPIAPGGGVCSDPQYGASGNTISALKGQSTVKSGVLIVSQSTAPGTTGAAQTTDAALGVFSQVSGASYGGGNQVSLNGCVLNETVTSSTSTSTTTVTGLDAGAITITGPSGGPVTLSTVPSVTGTYIAQLPAGTIPSSGGAFTFSGSGGSQVGAFTATINFPNPLLSWTNQSAAADVTRSSGLQVAWAGGASGSYVLVEGSSSSASGVSGSYYCITTQDAGQLTVPSYILLGLPAGTGTTLIENITSETTFAASGLDYGAAIGGVGVSVNSTYQ
jgi:uncharacterized protein (TIGR03437 family)